MIPVEMIVAAIFVGFWAGVLRHYGCAWVWVALFIVLATVLVAVVIL